MNNKVKLINELIYESGENADSFVFVTDTHNISNVMKSPLLINYIIKNTYIQKVIHGGDIIGTWNKSTKELNENGVKEDMMRQLKFVNYTIPYAKLYTTRGNHDFGSRGGTGISYGIDGLSTHNIFMNKLNPENNIISNDEDSTANYFYFDNNKQLTRYVFFDTSDITDSEGNSSYGVRTVQIHWIAEKAILTTPENYNLIFILHIPVERNASSDNSFQSVTNVA